METLDLMKGWLMTRKGKKKVLETLFKRSMQVEDFDSTLNCDLYWLIDVYFIWCMNEYLNW